MTGRQRAVIEGEHHLVVLQRQRLLVLHGAKQAEFAGIDGQHAAGAEGVWIAWARLRRGGTDTPATVQTNNATMTRIKRLASYWPASVPDLKIVNQFTAKSSLSQTPNYLTGYAPSIKFQLLLTFGAPGCRRIAIACHLKAEAPGISPN